ncbi:hypothetical protein Scep_024146 [Stephania cephalantha]|uniref:CCHC-type domain-containing protein n=1 Tax=Stephania cephalantha TaxID=152367 RepID=A0AAP0EW10_9MAGN
MEPIQIGRKVYLEEVDKEVPIVLQYGRLPDFCFHCGRLGHRHKECDDLKGKIFRPEKAKYGNWLRAKPLSQFRSEQQYGRQYPSPIGGVGR